MNQRRAKMKKMMMTDRTEDDGGLSVSLVTSTLHRFD
jgi:hypothetical protein